MQRYDLIVFGATSFVGQILCRHLVDRHGSSGPLRWAIAGRSDSKLADVAAATGAEVDRLVADASSAADMDMLAGASRVVVSTVGPYARYGSELVRACVNVGTDYCDLTGEPQWIQRMIDTHHADAERTGARIVHSCGFDSIPSDMGVFFTQREAFDRLGAHCVEISMRVRSLKGSASGGTVASLVNVVEEARQNPALVKALRNPYALAPADLRTGPRQRDLQRPAPDEHTGHWSAPFVMAGVNTKIVHRSHALLGRPWGPGFRYDEAMLTGSGPAGAARAAALTGGIGGLLAGAATAPGRRILERFLPKPGEGPTPEEQAAGRFDLRFFGRTAAGGEIVTKVTGDADPGYGSTAKMLGEAAVLLVETRGGAAPGGFTTPSVAFGSRLVDELVAHAGLTFDVLG